MTADIIFFLGYGAFFGGLVGWWARGRRDRRSESRTRVAELAGLLQDVCEGDDDPEVARRARLAYDTLYDEKHPEEWT